MLLAARARCLALARVRVGRARSEGRRPQEPSGRWPQARSADQGLQPASLGLSRWNAKCTFQLLRLWLGRRLIAASSGRALCSRIGRTIIRAPCGRRTDRTLQRRRITPLAGLWSLVEHCPVNSLALSGAWLLAAHIFALSHCHNGLTTKTHAHPRYSIRSSTGRRVQIRSPRCGIGATHRRGGAMLRISRAARRRLNRCCRRCRA